VLWKFIPACKPDALVRLDGRFRQAVVLGRVELLVAIAIAFESDGGAREGAHNLKQKAAEEYTGAERCADVLTVETIARK
jgi:hypothetical protein